MTFGKHLIILYFNQFINKNNLIQNYLLLLFSSQNQYHISISKSMILLEHQNWKLIKTNNFQWNHSHWHNSCIQTNSPYLSTKYNEEFVQNRLHSDEKWAIISIYQPYPYMPWYELSPQTITLINKTFMYIDLGLSTMSLLFCLLSLGNNCGCVLALIYCTYFLTQTCQHYLIAIFPKIDINLHHVLYKRAVICIGLLDSGYMFMTVTFWERSKTHPFYCWAC